MKETNNLYVIVEGKTDVSILKVLLNFERYDDVYMIPSFGYHRMPSLVRTLIQMRIRNESDDKFLVAFDSDSTDSHETEEKIARMKFLININDDCRIGVFSFQPNIEQYLGYNCKNYNKRNLDPLINYIKEHLTELREKEVVENIQKFLDAQ